MITVRGSGFFLSCFLVPESAASGAATRAPAPALRAGAGGAPPRSVAAAFSFSALALQSFLYQLILRTPDGQSPSLPRTRQRCFLRHVAGQHGIVAHRVHQPRMPPECLYTTGPRRVKTHISAPPRHRQPMRNIPRRVLFVQRRQAAVTVIRCAVAGTPAAPPRIAVPLAGEHNLHQFMLVRLQLESSRICSMTSGGRSWPHQ
jgi:hypothetical protein